MCDRATVLREGETVGVVDVTEGSEEQIVELMLGEIVEDLSERRRRRSASDAAGRARRRPRLSVRSLQPRHASSTTSRSSSIRARSSAWSRSRARARTSCSTSWPAPSGPSGGELLVDGTPVSFRHPADAIRAGLVYVAGRPRRGPADAALRAREHRPAVLDPAAQLGPDRHSARNEDQVDERRGDRCRSTRGRWARSAACPAATSRR